MKVPKRFASHATHNNHEEICMTWLKAAHYLGYGKGRAPLLFEDVKTDATIAINVRVENFCPEGNLHKFPKKSEVTQVHKDKHNRPRESRLMKWKTNKAWNILKLIQHT